MSTAPDDPADASRSPPDGREPPASPDNNGPGDHGIIDVIEGDPEDPFFREETRIPSGEDPTPPGLLDAVTHNLFGHARELMAWILGRFPGPATLRLWDGVWQWKKFELLDWLQPVEKLLRRILLIEAYALIETQSLPPVKPPIKTGREAQGGASPESGKDGPPYKMVLYDPDHPEKWRVNFRVIPRWPRKRERRSGYRRLGRIDVDHFRGDPRTPLRYRRVIVPSMPLARRLEAVIRICQDPAPFIRRLAFRLRNAVRATHEAVSLLCVRGRATRLARDANFEAADRLMERRSAFWSSS
jgi:hypothetical protein